MDMRREGVIESRPERSNLLASGSGTPSIWLIISFDNSMSVNASVQWGEKCCKTVCSNHGLPGT